MTRKIHFEKLTRGMQAKLNTRYRIFNGPIDISNDVNFIKAIYPERPNPSFLGDAIVTTHNRYR